MKREMLRDEAVAIVVERIVYIGVSRERGDESDAADLPNQERYLAEAVRLAGGIR